MEDDLHPDADGIHGQPLSDAAETDDTQGLSSQFPSFGILFLQVGEVGLAFERHLLVGAVERTSYREHVSQRQFGYRYRRGVRGVEHRASHAPGVSHVDVVHPHAGAGDDFQVRAGIDHILADFRGRAHDERHDVVVVDVFCEVFLCYGICDDGMSGFFKALYASFGQSVVGQYFHNVSNFCIVSISTWIFSLVIAL